LAAPEMNHTINISTLEVQVNMPENPYSLNNNH